MRTPGRAVAVAVGVVIVILSLGACGGNATRDGSSAKNLATLPRQTQPSSEGRFMTWDQFQRAVAAAIDDYQWPPNYRTTAPLVLGTDLGGRSRAADQFERGLEYTALDLYNRCAWEMAWLDARKAGNADAEVETLQVITDVLPNNPGTVGAPDLRRYQTAMGQKAALGDPTLIEGDVKTNCTTVRYVATPATPHVTAVP